MYNQYTSSRYGQAKLASISKHFNLYRCAGIEWLDDFTSILLSKMNRADTETLLHQGFLVVELNSSLRMF